MAKIKSERLNLRLDEFSKKKIEQAASVLQASVNSFILAAVLEKAEEVTLNYENMILSDRDRDIFFEAILNPDQANKSLCNAFKEHSQEVISDV